ncbi:hypothetical protein PO124_21525 [Bacillus licheniformis]|nr:hypothetical protein [Bacillus licheniformis]
MPSVSDAVAAVAAAMPQPTRRRQIAFTDIDFLLSAKFGLRKTASKITSSSFKAKMG